MKEENKITFDDIQKANETIITTDIKGKDYAEVNQRIKAFRMVYPTGRIETKLISNENGVCIFRAEVSGICPDCEGRPIMTVLATGTAYEKENSSFINKTSYIENCETSAVGRALGMAGFGIDTSIASADEVRNAMNNQLPTEEEAKEYIITFGKKHNGHKLIDVIENDSSYIDWILNNSKDEYLLKCVELLTGQVPLTEEEQKEMVDLMAKMNELITKTGVDVEDIRTKFNVKSSRDMSIKQLKECIKWLEEKK